jgi:hypothetical protein
MSFRISEKTEFRSQDQDVRSQKGGGEGEVTSEKRPWGARAKESGQESFRKLRDLRKRTQDVL